jgi:hypothetical protein
VGVGLILARARTFAVVAFVGDRAPDETSRLRFAERLADTFDGRPVDADRIVFGIVFGQQTRATRPGAQVSDFDLQRRRSTPSAIRAARSSADGIARTASPVRVARAAAVPAAWPRVMTVGVSLVEASASCVV